MSEYTPNLNLFKYDPINDSKVPFDIEKCLNENWDKLDNKLRSNILHTRTTNCILEAPNQVVTVSNNVVTIHQGLKVLFAYGRNTDKTLKNYEYTLPTDYTRDYKVTGLLNANTRGTLLFYTKPNNSSFRGMSAVTNYTQGSKLPSNFSGFFHNTEENTIQYYTNGALTPDWEDVYYIPIAEWQTDSRKNITLTPYNPVDILKRTDKAEIASWGFPSGTFQTLSTPTGGATYTAPSDGYFMLSAQTTATYGFITLNSNRNRTQLSSYCGINTQGVLLRCYLPVTQGTTINTELYNVEDGKLLFYSAQGEI